MVDPLDLLNEHQKAEAERALLDPEVQQRLIVSTLIVMRDCQAGHERRLKRLERACIFFTGMVVATAAYLGLK